MSRRTSRFAVSRPNAVIVVLLLAAAVAAVVTTRWFEAALLVAVAAVGYGTAVYARRSEVGDVTRVNALEYRDERDRHIAQLGFAVVGAAALIMGAIAFAVAVVLEEMLVDWQPSVQFMAAGYLLVLCLVWAIGNWWAARRF